MNEKLKNDLDRTIVTIVDAVDSISNMLIKSIDSGEVTDKEMLAYFDVMNELSKHALLFCSYVEKLEKSMTEKEERA